MSSPGSAARSARTTVRPPKPLSSTAMGAVDVPVSRRTLDLSDPRRPLLDFCRGDPDDPFATPAPRPHPRRAPAMSETLKDKRILLVDDDQDILTSMQAAFE